MKLIILTITALFAFLEISASPDDTLFDLPVHVEGKVSEIYVLEVSSIPSEWLESNLGGVFDDGFYISMLVVAKKKNVKNPAFQNFKEFYVNGEDYFKTTVQQMVGYRVMPVTTVDDVDNYKTLDGESVLPVEYNEKMDAVILYSYLAGATLPEIKSLTIPVYLGWDSKAEKFNIEIPVLGAGDESADSQ